MGIKASENIYGFIKGEEGFVAGEYDDGFGNVTQGYGMTTGTSKKKVTREEADHAMRERVRLAEEELSRSITRNDLTQGQQDVLVDMHFNMGGPNMKEFIGLINSRQDSKAASELLKYTKAFNKHTGQYEEVEALQKRVKKRASMWGQTIPQVQDILNDVLGRVDVQNLPQEDALAAALNHVDSDSVEMAQQVDPARRKKGLDEISEIANSEEALRNSEARRISRQLGIPLSEAKDRLAVKDANTIIAEQGHDLIAEHFPAVATWLNRDPDNYVMLRESGPYAQKVELAARNSRRDSRSDWAKAVDNNRVMMKEALTYLGMATGSVSIEEGKKIFLEIDAERQANALSSKAARTLEEVFNNPKATLTDKLHAMLRYPESAAQMMAQSQGSTVAIMGSAITAGAVGTAAGGPAIGAGAGATSAYMVSHLLSFSEHMAKQLEEFRDPITGQINIEAAYADPARVQKWKREADIYGLTMGAADAVFSLISGGLGAGVSKHVLKGGGSKVAKKAVAIAAEGGAKMLEEGGSQFVASTAVDIHRGEGLKNLKENYKEAENEALLSAGPAMGMTAIRHGAAKTIDVVKKATKANEDAVSVSALRAEVQSNEAYKKNPEAVRDLIDEASNPPPIPEDVHEPMVEVPEKLEKSEIRTMDLDAVQDTTAIVPSEFEAHYGSREKAIEALQVFGPDVVQAYARARETDSALHIPTADWVMFIENDPEIDAIARFNGNEMNALEANAAIEKLEKSPFALFEQDGDGPKGWDSIEPGDGADVQPIDPKNRQSPIEIIEADPTDPNNLKMRPVLLYSKFRDDSEREVHSSILSRLKKALPKETDVKMIETFTELQFRHMKNRAEMLGVSVQDLNKKLKIGKTKKGEDLFAHGLFKFTNLVDSPYTVAFAPTADVKTIVHEFGHSWLYEMALDYNTIMGINPDTMSLAQREYAMAMELMAQLTGLNNIGELLTADVKQAEIIQERFARTVELYFLEGNLENNNMRMLMESFRKWVVKVLDRIKNIGNWSTYPPMKLTPQFERAMEAIMGASSYVESEVVPMMPEPMFDPKVLGEKGQDYINTILLARSEAIGSAYTKAFNKGIKEREALIDKELNRIYDNANAEVDQLRSMQLMAGFTEAYNEYKNDPEGETPDPRLSFESFKNVLFNGDLLAAEAAKEKFPRVFVAGKKKGGIPVETFMMLNDIQSREELIDLMTEASYRDELVEAKVAELIEKEFPVLKTDDEIHEIAVAAVQSDGKEKLLMKEMKILMTDFEGQYKTLVSKLINPPAYMSKPSRENLQAAGDKMVLDANAFKFSANKFLTDSGRLGREASRRFRKNNIVEAIDAKVKEAVHFFAYKTARKAQKAVAQTTLRIKQFDKYARSKDLARRYDADVMAFGKQIIQLAGHGQKIPNLSRDQFSSYSGISEANIDQVNKAIERYERVAAGRYGKNVSVAGYMQLGELLRTLVFVARQAKEVEIEGRKEHIDAVGNRIQAEVATGNVVDVTGQGALSTFRQSVLNVRTLFESLYGSPEAFAASTLGKVYYSVTNAEAKRNLELQKYRDRIAKAVRGAAGDAGFVAPIVRRLPVPAKWKIEDKSSKPVLATKQDGFERDFQFKNKGELHMANLLMGSESGAKKFLIGHGLVKRNMETLALEPDYKSWENFIERQIREGVLTKKDFEMYNEIWASFDEIHPLVKDAMRRSDGFNMGYIQGWTVKNSLGEFTGGYVPVTPARDMMNAGMTDSLLEVDSMGYRIDSLYPNMNTGMTNERSQQYAELNLDMSRLNTYLSAALNIAYLRNPLLDFGKIMETPQVREAIEGRRPGAYGDAKSGMIVRWFNAVKAQEYTEFSQDVQEKIARVLRNNVNLAMYLGGWQSMLKQFFGFAPAIARVGGYNLLAANLRTGLGALRSSRQVMTEKSLMMRNRMSDSQEQMVRSWDKLDTNFDWINWTDDKVRAFQWFFIQMTQNMVDTSTWHAGYERAIKKGMTEEQAINFADDAVRSTQGSPDVSNMSNIQRGKDSYKLVTMVTAVPISMSNLLQAEVMRDQTKAARAKALVTLGLLAFVLPNMLDGVFSEATDDDDLDEEDEKEMDKAMGLIALRTATGSLDSVIPIPYVRMATSAIQFGTGSVSPGLAKPASSIAKAAKAGQNLYKGVDLSAKEVAGLMDSVTIITGLPASIIGKGFIFEDQFLLDETEREDRNYERRDQLAAAREE